MQINNLNRQSVIRRTVIALTLLFYFAVWVFLFCAVYSVSDEEADGAFAFGLLVISGGSFLIYFITYLTLFFVEKNKGRKDYLIALILILLPILIAVIDYNT